MAVSFWQVFEDEFLKLKNKSKTEFEGEVNSGRFPPYICYKILYTSPEENRLQPALLKIDIHGTNKNLTVSCEIMEEACTRVQTAQKLYGYT